MTYTVYPWYYDQQGAPQSHHSLFANRTFFWQGTDSFDLYNKNLQNPDNNALLEKYNLKQPITYTYNNHGFRNEPFDDRTAGLAVGCSFTEGTGLSIENTWPNILLNICNIHIWNLGISGAAFDTVFRILDYYLTKFNPKFVCVLIPPPHRMEYCDINGNYQIIQAHSTGTQSQFAKEWLLQEINGIKNRRKNLLAVKQLCNEANIPVFFQDSINPYLQHEMDLARDLMHYGKKCQHTIANNFSNQLQESGLLLNE